MPARLFLGAVVALMVAGCTGPASRPAVSPSARPVIALDGSLRAVPVAGQAPAVTAAKALEVLALQGVTVTGYDAPVLARVAWTATTDPSRPTGPLPGQGALAWVLVFHTPEPTPTCPVFSPDPIPQGGASRSDAVVVDAASGVAAVYTGRHSVCGRWTTPRIAPARRYWSVGWTQAGPRTVRVTLPPCGVVSGSGLSNDQLSVIAATALDVPCAGPPTTAVTNDITSYNWAYLTHAPVGPVCSTLAPGASGPPVQLPTVPGCVRLR